MPEAVSSREGVIPVMRVLAERIYEIDQQDRRRFLPNGVHP
jgi:hypothetical protein